MVVSVNFRRSRSVAALAVAMLVLGHLQVSVHTSQVRHVVCAEHGELVEAPELAGGTIDGDSRLVSVTLSVDADEHCPAATGLRPHLTSSVVFAQIALIPTPPVASPIAIARAPALSGYRIAPKTSPPALALTV